MRWASKRNIEKLVEEMFYRLANNIQFNIMDLGKISRAAEDVLIQGGALCHAESAMLTAIDKYRIDKDIHNKNFKTDLEDTLKT